MGAVRVPEHWKVARIGPERKNMIVKGCKFVKQLLEEGKLIDGKGQQLDPEKHGIALFNIGCNLYHGEDDDFKSKHPDILRLAELVYETAKRDGEGMVGYFIDSVPGWYHPNQSFVEFYSVAEITWGPVHPLGLEPEDLEWVIDRLEKGVFCCLVQWVSVDEENKEFPLKFTPNH